MQTAFIGYGELGEQVHALIQQANPAMQSVFFDDELFAGKATNAFPFSAYEADSYKNYSFIIYLGYKRHGIT